MKIIIKLILISIILFSTNIFSQNNSTDIEKFNKKELKAYIENLQSHNDSIIKINKTQNDSVKNLVTERQKFLNKFEEIKKEIKILNDSIENKTVIINTNKKVIDSLSTISNKNKTETFTPNTNITFTDELVMNPKKEYTNSVKLIIDKIILKDNYNAGKHSVSYENESGESKFTSDNNNNNISLTKIVDSKNYFYAHPKTSKYNERIKYKSENLFLNFKTIDKLSEELPLFTFYKSKFLNLKNKNESVDFQINISEINSNKNKKYVQIEIQNKNNDDEKINVNIHQINNENYLVMNYEQLYFLGLEFRNHSKGYSTANNMVTRFQSFKDIIEDNSSDLDESQNYFLLVEPKNSINDIEWLSPKDVYFLIKMIEVK